LYLSKHNGEAVVDGCLAFATNPEKLSHGRARTYTHLKKIFLAECLKN